MYTHGTRSKVQPLTLRSCANWISTAMSCTRLHKLWPVHLRHCKRSSLGFNNYFQKKRGTLLLLPLQVLNVQTKWTPTTRQIVVLFASILVTKNREKGECRQVMNHIHSIGAREKRLLLSFSWFFLTFHRLACRSHCGRPKTPSLTRRLFWDPSRLLLLTQSKWHAPFSL